MRPRVFKAVNVPLLTVCTALAVLPDGRAEAAKIPPPSGVAAAALPADNMPRELQLEVFVNGRSTELIAAFLQEADGTLAIEPDQLRNVGIQPTRQAARPDGLIDISRLPNVSFEYDGAMQAIRFSADFEALSAHVVDADRRRSDAEAGRPKAQSSYGALVNYTLFASTGGDDVKDMWAYDGASAWLEGRVFGPYGTVSSGFVARGFADGGHDTIRLDTTWSYSHPGTMTSYSVGDVITGGLGWTRPVRLGGVQIRRNFDLRPDLVTMPLPEISGSAAVPSTVDLYVNNARRLSREVPPGPFQVTNLPVVTGGGTARVVVRDALGRRSVVERPFFASSRLLTTGLLDFSAEAGFARRFHGIRSNDYDDRLLGSGTIRYGLNDQLTLEGHLEGGAGLVNGGGGAVFALGSLGVASIAGSASSHHGRTGHLLAGSLELALGEVRVSARTQRTFGDYRDIASVTAVSEPLLRHHVNSAAPPRALDQVSLSVPLRFDPATLNFSYTHVERIEGDRSQILSFSLNRRVGKASLYASAFTDLEEKDSFGLFVGLSVPLGDRLHASTGLTSDSNGTSVSTELMKSERAEVGSIGWRLRDVEGDRTNRAASISYRAPFARFEAGVEQDEDRFRATGQIDGAVVLAGNDVFFSERIDDAFAVVDAGAPGVAVEHENRPVGMTNGRGKLLVPDLRSYEANNISIDPANLPVDATVGGTRETAVPADRSGTVVKFDVERQAQAALVTLRDEQGQHLPAGIRGALENGGHAFVVGYEGQAFISGLRARNQVRVALPGGGQCVAAFSFTPRPGEQVVIPDAVCRSTE